MNITKGKWEVDKARNGIVRCGHIEIARTKAYRASKSLLERPSELEAEANAILCACAPELLELAERALQILYHSEVRKDNIVDDLIAIVRKAKGKQ